MNQLTARVSSVETQLQKFEIYVKHKNVTKSKLLKILSNPKDLYIINFIEIAYHQNEVLYIIKPTEIHTSCDDIHLRR